MSQKYELIAVGNDLYQIKALRDIYLHRVKTGDLGGIVQTSRNLSQRGDCWIEKGSFVGDEARVSENAFIKENSNVISRASVRGNAVVRGESWLQGRCVVTDSAIVNNCGIFDTSVVADKSRIELVELHDNCLLLGNTKIKSKIKTDFAMFHNLRGEITDKDYLLQGPALSSGNHSTAYRLEDASITVVTGCFRGTLDEYLQAIEDTHKDNPEYLAQYRQFHQNFVDHFSK